MPDIFVFGSNLAGRHGKGAAKVALREHGARTGLGEGLAGKSYALPTKDRAIRTLPLSAIAGHVEVFLRVAAEREDLRFLVTSVGCGLAGYTPADIAPLFAPALALKNVYLPEDFCAVLEGAIRVSFTCEGTRGAGLD